MTGDSGSLTLHEVADHLGVHYMTAYRWVRTGLMDATKHGGQWRVLADDVRVPDRRPPGRRPASTVTLPGELVPVAERLGARLLAGDEPGSWQVLQDAMTGGLDPADVHVSLIAAAMQFVGDRWAAGEVSIADEHRATAVATRLVGRQGPLFLRRGASRAAVVVGAVAGDRHALPVSILADVLRRRGLGVVELGADTPALSFVSMVPADPGPENPVPVIALCMTYGENRDAASLVATIRSARPGVPILLGGAAVHNEKHAMRMGADGWTGSTALEAADAIEQLVDERSAKVAAT